MQSGRGDRGKGRQLARTDRREEEKERQGRQTTGRKRHRTSDRSGRENRRQRRGGMGQIEGSGREGEREVGSGRRRGGPQLATTSGG